MNPTGGDIHIDVPLSNISTAYKNPQSAYVADQIFPVIGTSKKSDKFYQWKKDDWFRSKVEDRAPGDTYPETELTLATDDFVCKLRHLGYALPWEDLANQDDAIDLEVVAASHLADQFMLKRELVWAEDYFKTGVWSQDVTLAGTNQWSDLMNSDPIQNIQTGCEYIQSRTGKWPNTLVIGKQVKNVLRRHPDLVDLYRQAQVTPVLSNDQIAAALDVQRIIVGDAIKNTAKEGATFSGSYILGKRALLAWVPQAPGKMTPSAGYTFVWEEVAGLKVQVSRIVEEARDRDFLKGKSAWVHKVVGKDLGYMIAAAIA